MILTLTDFQSGYLKLPNATVSPNGADFTTGIQEIIDEKEREILIDALGIEFYDTLVTEYADLGTASKAVTDLVSGYQYELNGVTVKWEGLLNSPLLGCYIYYHFMQEKQDIFTTMGTQSPEAVNSVAVSSIDRAVRMYRKFLKAYQGGDSMPLIVKTSLVSGIDYLGAQSHIRSLYQFLEDQKSMYPTVTDFILHEPINTFGI